MTTTTFVVFSALPVVAALAVLWLAFLPRIRRDTPGWLWWVLIVVALALLALPLLIRLIEVDRAPLYSTIGIVVLGFGILHLIRATRGERPPRRQVGEAVEAAGWGVLGGSFLVVAREATAGTVGILLGILVMGIGTMLGWWNDWLDARAAARSTTRDAPTTPAV